MTLPRPLFLLSALSVAALSLTGCKDNPARPAVLQVVDGTIRPGATPDSPAAGYFTVEGGPAPVALVAVTADLAQRVEMHESRKDAATGMVTMAPLVRADIPAKGEVKFAPGGKHVMIWGINPAAIKAGRLPMVFVFTNNDRIVLDMRIVAPEPAAAGANAADAKSDEHASH